MSKPLPLLRSWLNAGLEFVLAEDSARVKELLQFKPEALEAGTGKTEALGQEGYGSQSRSSRPGPQSLGSGRSYSSRGWTENQAENQAPNQAENQALGRGFARQAGPGPVSGGAAMPGEMPGSGSKSAPEAAFSQTASRRAAGAGLVSRQGEEQKARPAGSNASPVSNSRNLAPDGKALLTPDSWPPAWIALRDRRPLPPRPLVLWTYPGLEDDLLGQPNPARQEVVVRLLRSLNHPAGTHVFWPARLPGESSEALPAEQAGASFFWSAEAMFRPRMILAFGSQSLEGLGLAQMPLFGQQNISPRRILLLPTGEELAEDQALFRRSLDFLLPMLRFCAARS